MQTIQWFRFYERDSLVIRARSLTEVHVCSPRPQRERHVLVHGIQDLLLHLRNGVTVQHLDRDLWAVLVVRVHAAQRLDHPERGRRRRSRRQRVKVSDGEKKREREEKTDLSGVLLFRSALPAKQKWPSPEM